MHVLLYLSHVATWMDDKVMMHASILAASDLHVFGVLVAGRQADSLGY